MKSILKTALTVALLSTAYLFSFSQNIELDVRGSIKSKDLANGGSKIVLADDDGVLKSATNTDTVQLSLIQLVDDSGDVRMEFDANAGRFRMLDDDTTFYQVQVQSPPALIYRDNQGNNQVRLSDPGDLLNISIMLTQDAGTVTGTYADIINEIQAGSLISARLIMSDEDLDRINNDMQPEGGVLGEVYYLDEVGVRHKLEVGMHGENPTDHGILLEIPSLGLKFFRPTFPTPPVQQLTESDSPSVQETSVGSTLFGFNADGSSFGFSSGYTSSGSIPRLGMDIFLDNPLTSITNYVGLTSGDGLEIQQVDNNTSESMKANLQSDELEIKDETNDMGSRYKYDGINFFNGSDENNMHFDPLNNNLVFDGNFAIIPPGAVDFSAQMDKFGFFCNNFSNSAQQFYDIFGISKLIGSAFVALGFDAAGGSIDAEGDFDINGVLSKTSGTFKIDHPLDPENKWLYHSFVESPDMMNIYNGNVTTDETGTARVELPTYFNALNIDYRYQLTVIGSFAQAVIWEKIENNVFTIKTDEPNIEVSWQVTGVRNDKFARENRVQVEVEKTGTDKGRRKYDPEREGPYNLELREQWMQRK